MGQKPTILVIDDSKDALEILRTLLEESGYRVLLASDGQQGLALAHAEKPDLILLDIMMPAMSGFQVCQSLKADPVCEQVPIVILTARKVERDWSYARTVGADDFLTKPIRPSQLRATIAKHIAGTAPQKPAHQLGLRQILVISDDPALVRLLSGAFDAHNFLQKAGSRYDLAEVASFLQARAAIEQHVPAAIVVDAKSRGEPADQIVRRLKTDPKHKGLPLVVVRPEKGDELKFAWADARLPGPPNGKAVIAAIADLVEK